MRKLTRPLSPQKLLERDVTKQIRDYMEFRQWRAIRMQRTVVPGQFQTGEPGIADFLFVRYLNTELIGLSVSCWIELKRASKGRVSEDQITWRDRERHRGAIVLLVNNLRHFEVEYERLFGWLRTELWVSGQTEITFAEVSNSSEVQVTTDLQHVSQRGATTGCQSD